MSEQRSSSHPTTLTLFHSQRRLLPLLLLLALLHPCPTAAHDECAFTRTTCVPYLAPLDVNITREVAAVTGLAATSTMVGRLPPTATVPALQSGRCTHCTFFSEDECSEVASTCAEDFMTNVECARVKSCSVACTLTKAGLARLDSLKALHFSLGDRRGTEGSGGGGEADAAAFPARAGCTLEGMADPMRLAGYTLHVDAPCEEHNPRHNLPWHSLRVGVQGGAGGLNCTARATVTKEKHAQYGFVTIKLEINAGGRGRGGWGGLWVAVIVGISVAVRSGAMER